MKICISVRAIATLGAMLIVIQGCGGSGSEPSTSTPAQATPTAVPTLQAPTPTPAPPPAPPSASPPSGPLFAWVYQGEVRRGSADVTTFALPDGTYRQLWSEGNEVAASSRDGLRWTSEGSAGFPPGIVGGRVMRLRDGRYRFYTGINNLRVLTSSDGRTWQEEPSSTIKAPEPGCTGCYFSLGDVAIMPDGSYRMLYEHRTPSALLPGTGINPRIHSATSSDGLVWQVDSAWNSNFFVDPSAPYFPGPGPGATHPRVVTLADGTYKLFCWSGYAILSATSRDGQTWTNRKLEDVFGADPDVLMLPDGRIVLFVDWLDDSQPPSPTRQYLWSYVWQQVPFAFPTPAPAFISMRTGESQSSDFTLTGNPGSNVRFTATVYSTAGIYAAGAPGSPVQIQLTAAPGSTSVRLSIAGSRASFGGVIITADDGTTRVSSVVPFSIAAAGSR